MRALVISLLALAACGGSSHRHGPPRDGDPRKLYVEISAGGSHERRLRAGASEGLARVSFAVPVNEGGEIELQVDLSELDVIGNETVCKVKVMVLRLPDHALVGIADGTARARGTHDEAGDDCIEQLGATLIRGKVRALLQRQLRAKR